MRLLENPLPVDRFRELLHSAAEASYIGPGELKALSVAGLTKLIANILENRLLMPDEEERILKVMEALGFTFESRAGPHETLVKIDILRELRDGVVPDHVNVAGPLPIELRRGETIIWVFNHVVSYLQPKKGRKDLQALPAGMAPDEGGYFTHAMDKSQPVPKRKLTKEASGDIVVTNRNIYLLSSNAPPRRIPVGRISDVRCYKDAVSVISGAAEQVSRMIVLEDPWFAANLIWCLFRFART